MAKKRNRKWGLKGMNKYVGHDSQAYGIEEHRLVGGKGDGMRLLQVRNGKGLDFTVAVDRCADIYRLSFKGINMGFPVKITVRNCRCMGRLVRFRQNKSGGKRRMES